MAIFESYRPFDLKEKTCCKDTKATKQLVEVANNGVVSLQTSLFIKDASLLFVKKNNKFLIFGIDYFYYNSNINFVYPLSSGDSVEFLSIFNEEENCVTLCVERKIVHIQTALKSYSLDSIISSNLLLVNKNGEILTLGIDYTITGNDIFFAYPLSSNDKLELINLKDSMECCNVVNGFRQLIKPTTNTQNVLAAVPNVSNGMFFVKKNNLFLTESKDFTLNNQEIVFSYPLSTNDSLEIISIF